MTYKQKLDLLKELIAELDFFSTDNQEKAQIKQKIKELLETV